jgi:hypothetical protein
MAAIRVQNGLEPETIEEATAALSMWSRCEAALSGSRITVAASDQDGRYMWVFNPPAELPTDVIGKLDSDFLPAAAAHALSAAKQNVLASGETSEIELELEGTRGPRWYDVRIRLHSDLGRVVGTVSSMVDITDRKIQEEHLRLVLRELAHRSKNLLAVIQGIARQTAESASSTQQFVSRFNGRIFPCRGRMTC